MDYASFGERFAAKFVDGLIVGLPLMVIMFAIMIPMVRSSNANGGDNAAVGLIQIFIQLGFILVNMAYQIFFLGKFNATPGKMLCKLKVVTSDGKSFGYSRATGRFFAEMLSGMTCYIGYLLVLFDKEKRALHDHICNTRVVHK
jgi:uncharacterized RDD family membrane protein YckC